MLLILHCIQYTHICYTRYTTIVLRILCKICGYISFVCDSEINTVDDIILLVL